MIVRAIGALGALLFLLGAPASTATLRGEAFYRERIALPPQAVFEAVLEDISRADAPAKILGLAQRDPAGQPPFHFEINYEDAALLSGGRYAVRGKVTVDGKLLFTTDRIVSAFGPQPLELLLVKATRHPKPSNTSLQGAYWKLTQLGASPVQVSERGLEPYFTLAPGSGAGKVSGSGGCNRFNGGFTLEGDRLRFSRMPAR